MNSPVPDVLRPPLVQLAGRMKAYLQRELDAHQTPRFIDLADLLPFLEEAAQLGAKLGPSCNEK